MRPPRTGRRLTWAAAALGAALIALGGIEPWKIKTLRW
jgi:hypothetical protein